MSHREQALRKWSLPTSGAGCGSPERRHRAAQPCRRRNAMALKGDSSTLDEALAKADHANGKMKRKVYEKELQQLQVELCRLQEWVKETGERIIILFEGRDAAGKGGTIKAITERVSPRVFRVVALPAPSHRQKTEMFMQRYIRYFPAAGEVIIFDRSWYNRAGVEYVMGFCTETEHQRFLDNCPQIEKYIVDAGSSVPKTPSRILDVRRMREFAKLVVDQTGCGRPACDILRRAGLRFAAVTISAGDTETYVG